MAARNEFLTFSEHFLHILIPKIPQTSFSEGHLHSNVKLVGGKVPLIFSTHQSEVLKNHFVLKKSHTLFLRVNAPRSSRNNKNSILNCKCSTLPPIFSSVNSKRTECTEISHYFVFAIYVNLQF